MSVGGEGFTHWGRLAIQTKLDNLPSSGTGRPGQTPTYQHVLVALRAGDVGALGDLIAQGADITEIDPTEGWALVHMAAAYNDSAVLQLLIDHNASITVLDKAGRSPLHRAVAASSEQGVAALLAAGAPVNFRELQGNSALHLGAVFNVPVPIITRLHQAGAEVAAVNKRGDTPLLCAADNRAHGAAAALLELGADAMAANAMGSTPLHRATINNDVRMVEMLAARPETKVSFRTRSGVTPLLIAAEANASAVLPVLLQAGAKIDETNPNFGSTALHRAVWANAVESIVVLLEAGAPIEKTDDDGNTPLIVSVMQNCLAAAKLLLEAGCKIEAVSLEGNSALSVARRAGFKDMLALLEANYAGSEVEK